MKFTDPIVPKLTHPLVKKFYGNRGAPTLVKTQFINFSEDGDADGEELSDRDIEPFETLATEDTWKDGPAQPIVTRVAEDASPNPSIAVPDAARAEQLSQPQSADDLHLHYIAELHKRDTQFILTPFTSMHTQRSA